MIEVVGGTYNEFCHFPEWHQLFGSGGRAAAALASLSDRVVLSTFSSNQKRAGCQALADCFGFELGSVVEADDVSFEYLHPLKRPSVWPPRQTGGTVPAIQLTAPIVLRYGCWEGEAVVKADVAVYDPQSPTDPTRFDANGSRAKRLAIVCNREEGSLLTGHQDREEILRSLLQDHGAEVVVLKVGPTGAVAASRDGARYRIPAYRSDCVFPIGSGDVFSAVFAHYWAEVNKPLNVAADLASKATAWYCATRTFPRSGEWGTTSSMAWRPVPLPSDRAPRIYIAGPFFSVQQLWIVEELRAELTSMGVEVFSPYHDVGCFSSARDIATRDLDGLRSCDAVLAILDGLDPGTIFEIGYARSNEIPVVGLLQQRTADDFKMFDGTDVSLDSDLPSAVYRVVWTAIEKAR